MQNFVIGLNFIIKKLLLGLFNRQDCPYNFFGFNFRFQISSFLNLILYSLVKENTIVSGNASLTTYLIFFKSTAKCFWTIRISLIKGSVIEIVKESVISVLILNIVFQGPIDNSCTMPMPAMSMLCCDLSSHGKLNMFKDVLILPKLNPDIYSVFLVFISGIFLILCHHRQFFLLKFYRGYLGTLESSAEKFLLFSLIECIKFYRDTSQDQ